MAKFKKGKSGKSSGKSSSQKRPGVRKFKKNKDHSKKSTTKSISSKPSTTTINNKLGRKVSKKDTSTSKFDRNDSITSIKLSKSPSSSSNKRVSFSSRLVLGKTPTSTTKEKKIRRTINDNDSIEAADGSYDNESPSSTPLKPILKKRHHSSTTSKKNGQPTKKKLKISTMAQVENDENDEEDSTAKKLIKKKKKSSTNETANNEDGTATKPTTEILSRKERKENLLQLKAKRKPYLDLAVKAKKLWEQIRNQKKRKNEDRQKLIDDLYGLVEGKVQQLIYAHDTVRVIQCLMALKGNTVLRTKLFDEVKDEIIPMSKSKYARFFVIKMLKYGTPAQRDYIMQRFYGKIPQLTKHAVAAEVVEYAYNEYANALQRSRIISEFYSPEYALWKVEEATSLDKIFAKEPERKKPILESMKEHISDLSTKPVLKHSLIHRLIREFLDHCGDEDRKEVIDLLKERIVEMVHTKEGVICAMRSIWYGNAKERKIIVKTLKSLVFKLCQEEHGHLLLLAIFDSLDDTLVVQKTVLKEIIQHLDEIARNKHGAKVLHYLLKPRANQHFMKEVVALMAEGDQNPHSKKDKASRHSELLEHMSPILLQYAAENMKMLMSENPLLILSILENAIGDKTDAYRTLCVDILAEEFIPMNIDNLHAIEQPKAHFVLKKLIKNDKILHEKGEKTFSETLMEELSTEHLLSWMSCNRGAFILLYMFETDIPEVKDKVETIVKSSGGRKKLKQYTFPAAKILAQKVH